MSADALIESYRAEAVALLEANQAARSAAQRLGILIVVVVGLAVAGALVADEPLLVLVGAPLALVLSALMFQQFADVTVMGAARHALEERLTELGAGGFIYERYVAGIRKRPPLVGTTRALQALMASGTLGLTVTAAAIAFTSAYRWTTPTAFTVVTVPALALAAASYRDMLRSGAVARSAALEMLASERRHVG